LLWSLKKSFPGKNIRSEFFPSLRSLENEAPDLEWVSSS
jgi:hypothetical protein